MSMNPHEPKSKIPQKQTVTLGEVLVPGKPILLTHISENAAVSAAKEEAWKKDLEPVEVDCELLPPDAIEASVKSVPPGGFVILGETRRASDENLAKVYEIVGADKERILVVTRPYEEVTKCKPIDPFVFTNAGGHSIKL